MYLGEQPPEPFAPMDLFQWKRNWFLRTTDLVPCLSDKFYLILNFIHFALVYFSCKLIWAYLVLLIYYWYCFVTLLINYFGQFSNYTSKSPFYRWLVMRSRLGTWETMLHWGSYMGDLNYSFYKKSMECRAHLHFECPLSKLNINCIIRGKWWVREANLKKEQLQRLPINLFLPIN